LPNASFDVIKKDPITPAVVPVIKSPTAAETAAFVIPGLTVKT
jgi:hypothetical protein